MNDVTRNSPAAAVAAELDLDACAREPIHIPGGIQPHGVLLVLSGPELTVVQASANAGALAGRETREVLDRPLDRVADEGEA